MRVLRSEPELYDLPAWKRRLADLLSDAPEDQSVTLIEDTKAHIDALERVVEKRASEAR